MVSYLEWFKNHAEKHKTIMKKLEGKSKEDIVEYFSFENMCKQEPDFCELYKTKTKCHEMYGLNCYMCGCPHYRFYQTPIMQNEMHIHSMCAINSKRGKRLHTKGEVHQDCSKCTIPHNEDYILNNFEFDWNDVMKEVKC